MKWTRIVYWMATGPLIAMMVFAAWNYLFKHELMVDVFSRLGYPSYIIYPLAIAKLFGIAAIISNWSPTLKEWAYAGFFFNFLLALSGHLNAGDWQFAPAAVCLTLLAISYVLDKQSGDK